MTKGKNSATDYSRHKSISRAVSEKNMQRCTIKNCRWYDTKFGQNCCGFDTGIGKECLATPHHLRRARPGP